MEAIAKRRKRRAEEGGSSEIRPASAVDVRPPRGERAVDDKEVDEFFSILRRLRDARRMVTWRPAFTLDDFREEMEGGGGAAIAGAGAGGVVADCRRFDLNAEPLDEEEEGMEG